MNTRSPHPVVLSEESLNHPGGPAAFRSAKLLVGAYLAVSVLTMAAIVALRSDASLVNSAVWIRGSIVVVSALLLLVSAVRAAAGSPGAYRRLRVLSAVMVAAIVAVITLPGAFPLWMKIEQGVCGLLLICVAVIANGRQLRSAFATK
ncbi:hypothetical protein [Streptantibioticus silvisoli]|jgi:hypothetical protein|uniref:Integral membrane protein n=1 Tax=Streptantibioticus silvisoli TaxID=2705255 RepID=A0ABT6VY35_9ACTN|nr:hypothetical protein [Streptantibioticus silvisoli]MDI5963403.1 hypothetical protein [Streptantibioticus silvisoli]